MCAKLLKKSKTSFLFESELIAQQSATAEVLIYVRLLLTSQNCRLATILHTIFTVQFCALLLQVCFSFHSWLTLATGAKKVTRYCRMMMKKWAVSFPNHGIPPFGLNLVFPPQYCLKGSWMLKWFRFFNAIILVEIYKCKCIAHTVCLLGLPQGIINVFTANFFAVL